MLLISNMYLFELHRKFRALFLIVQVFCKFFFYVIKHIFFLKKNLHFSKIFICTQPPTYPKPANLPQIWIVGWWAS